MRYVLALDQGTTSSRAIVFDSNGGIVASAQEEFRQIFPEPGWVEHSPREIWETQRAVARSLLTMDGIPVGRELGRWYLREHTDRGDADGSVMVVIATDAPALPPGEVRRRAQALVDARLVTVGRFLDAAGDLYLAAIPTADVPVLSDDFAPIDALIPTR